MNNFGNYITPKQAYAFDVKNGNKGTSVKYYERLANAKPRKCCVCDYEEIWKYGRSGMCFSCTTGENDASEDYELIGI